MGCTIDTYTDYLLATTAKATATGMSELYDGEISHDAVTRFLTESYLDASTVFAYAKPLLRLTESADEGVLIADDTIVEKAHTDENAMISWHWEHSKKRMVKGVNLLSLIYHAADVVLPINAHLVEKTEPYTDKKTGQIKYRSSQTKNDVLRGMLLLAKQQNIKYRYFLADSWFSSAETMNFIQEKLNKHYIMAVESSREVALSEQDKLQGRFHRVDSLCIPENGRPLRVWLRSLKHSVVVARQVFTNKDRSQGVLYLLSNDSELDVESMTTIYKKRWKVEEYHKSLKQHTAIAASPTKTIRTQANHLYASLVAYIKLQRIKIKHGKNHFAIKAMIIAAATKAAFLALHKFLA